MSEIKPSGQVDQVSGQDQQDKGVVSYDSHAKLLGEKKKLQEKLGELQAYKDQLEQEKLQAEGQWKELAQKNKTLADDFKTKNLNIIKQVSEKAVKSQFLREAEKLGCVDSDLAFKAVSFDDLEITEDFEFDSQKLVSKIQDLTKSKPHLFKKNFQLPPDQIPSNQNMATKNLSELTENEIKQLLKQL